MFDLDGYLKELISNYRASFGDRLLLEEKGWLYQAMSKYDPLWEYIKTNAPSKLTFDEAREICGFPIDHAFLNCKKELEAYGHQVGKISMKKQTVEFHHRKE